MSSCVTLISIAVWATVCIYYAVVEEPMTTVAHAVSFAVGLGAWVLFEKLHQIPLVEPVNLAGAGEGGGDATMPPTSSPPYEQLRDDVDG